MEKEQEEAIDYIQKQIDYFKKQIKFIEAVDRTYYAAEYELYKNRVKQFETVLSMLKENSAEIEQKNTELAEKNTEIEKLKQILARNTAGNVISSMKETVKSKEDLEMLNKGWQIELEKKDKQINFMANFINDNTPYTKDTKELENEEGIRTVDFTVKYFERKATNNG